MSDARELQAIREIAHAFLLAEHPGDVQQFALDRVTPLLGATFSLVMQLGDDGELLRPIAQHEWPAAYRQWIGALRVRVGDGPSGVAVAERRLVEVVDLFDDPALETWHDVARELGFRSILAAPLETGDGPIGAVAFYFADATRVSDEQRALVRLVADQLAAATDKSRRSDALRRANAALAEANAELESQATEWQVAQRLRDASETLVVDAMLSLTGAADPRGAVERLQALHALALSARDYVEVTTPGFTLTPGDVDPREALHEVVTGWRTRAAMVPMQVDEPTVILPTMRTDPRWLRRTLDLVIGLGVLGGAVEGGQVRVGIRLGRGFLAVQVSWEGRAVFEAPPAELVPGPPHILRVRPAALRWEAHDPFVEARCRVSAVDLPLARALASRQGGELRLDTAGTAEDTREMLLVFPVDADRE